MPFGIDLGAPVNTRALTCKPLLRTRNYIPQSLPSQRDAKRLQQELLMDAQESPAHRHL